MQELNHICTGIRQWIDETTMHRPQLPQWRQVTAISEMAIPPEVLENIPRTRACPILTKLLTHLSNPASWCTIAPTTQDSNLPTPPLQRNTPAMCVARRTRCPDGHATYTVLSQCPQANIKLPHSDRKMCMRRGDTTIVEDNDSIDTPPDTGGGASDQSQRREASLRKCSHWRCRKEVASSWVCEDLRETRRSITVHLLRPGAEMWDQR